MSLRRIAELRKGRRTECVAQLARDQRSRFTYFVYDGRQVLVPEYLHELSTAEQVFPYGKDGKTHEVQRFRDVLKNVCVMTDEQDRTYVLLGIEGNGRSDLSSISVRICHY